MSETFNGADFFGRAIIGVRGKSGSVILMRPAREDEEADTDVTMSIGTESAKALAKWLADTGELPAKDGE